MGAAWNEEEVLALLAKAANAVLAAEVMAGAGEAMADSLIFNAQQAAEFSLRAYLAASGEIGKGKNLAGLLGRCAAMNRAFLELEPAKLDAAGTAIDQARKTLEIVRLNLPPEIKVER